MRKISISSGEDFATAGAVKDAGDAGLTGLGEEK
jgi:hypothetical protein